MDLSDLDQQAWIVRIASLEQDRQLVQRFAGPADGAEGAGEHHARQSVGWIARGRSPSDRDRLGPTTRADERGSQAARQGAALAGRRAAIRRYRSLVAAQSPRASVIWTRVESASKLLGARSSTARSSGLGFLVLLLAQERARDEEPRLHGIGSGLLQGGELLERILRAVPPAA